MDVPWGTIFASTIWNLWKTRNNRHFNNIDMDHIHVATCTLKFADDIHNAFDTLVETSTRNQDLIKWFFPRAGTVKINSDGSTFGNHRWAAYGGLARDDRGRWIKGFCGRIGYGTLLQIGVFSVSVGVKITRPKPKPNVKVRFRFGSVSKSSKPKPEPNFLVRFSYIFFKNK